MQKPTIGRIVLALVDASINNGSNIAPAVITRVWSESGPDRWTVNYKILLDQGSVDTLHRSSAYLHADEDAARAAVLSGYPYDDDAAARAAVDGAQVLLNHQAWSSGTHAFWPARG